MPAIFLALGVVAALLGAGGQLQEGFILQSFVIPLFTGSCKGTAGDTAGNLSIKWKE